MVLAAVRSQHAGEFGGNGTEIVGVVDDEQPAEGGWKAGKWLGRIEDAVPLARAGAFDEAVVSMSGLRSVRRSAFCTLSEAGIKFANVFAEPSVIEAEHFGRGNLVMPFSRVGPRARIGDNNFLSSYVNVEHHCVVGSHCTFGPAVFFSGRVTVGDRVKFGTGVHVEPGVEIGDDCVVGSGVMLAEGARVEPGSVVTMELGELTTVRRQAGRLPG
jgi:carbonic anhydrase/acetyltransferase-like protein (isoleucine patch superfamily)